MTSHERAEALASALQTIFEFPDAVEAIERVIEEAERNAQLEEIGALLTIVQGQLSAYSDSNALPVDVLRNLYALIVQRRNAVADVEQRMREIQRARKERG